MSQEKLSRTPDQLHRLAEFIFEAGQLRHTPRSGYEFLGSGKESVAEHSFRTAIIGYALARRAGADPCRTAMLCLFHDVPEARTADMNYVNKRYVQVDDRRAMEDACTGTGLEDDLLPLFEELAQKESLEAQLAHDADQLDLIFNLRREQDLGNPYATAWLENVNARLKSPQGKELAKAAAETDHTDWWLHDVRG